MYCRNCGKQIDEKAAVCINCGVPPRLEKKFCHNCGTASTGNQTICLSCGVTLARGASQKSKPTATLLGIFLGPLGALKFYMGSWGWGIVYLVLCLTFFLAFIPIIANLVEYIRIILMSDDEFAVKAEAFENKGPFGFFW
jgi:TM2 domain-containing membrane protein YozV